MLTVMQKTGEVTSIAKAGPDQVRVHTRFIDRTEGEPDRASSVEFTIDAGSQPRVGDVIRLTVEVAES